MSLPVAEAREVMIRRHLSDRSAPDLDYSQVKQTSSIILHINGTIL